MSGDGLFQNPENDLGGRFPQREESGSFRVVDLATGLWPELLLGFFSRLPPVEARINALFPSLVRELSETTHSFHAGLVNPRAGGIVGLLGGYCVLDEVEIHTFYLRPDFRNRGLGSKMIRKFFFACQRSGVLTIHLEVRSRSAARGLYTRLGFEQIGIRPGYYGPEWSPEEQSDDAIGMMYTVAPVGDASDRRRALLAHLSGDLGDF